MEFLETPTEPHATEISEYEKERGKPAPSLLHGLVQTNLAFLIIRDFGSTFSTPSELELAFLPKNAVPDICIYPKMHINFEEEDTLKMKEPPLTAIEILSPKQALEDVLSKARKLYFANGVKSVWIVLTSLKTVVVMTPSAPPSISRKAT
jgi:Uma2 family endonuclease